MRWLVTGAGGMLGRDLVALLEQRGAEVTAATRGQLDITDPPACANAVAGHDVVVNCAGWTAVDAAEAEEAAAYRVNAVGAATLAGAARSHSARLVQISTDYVFDGDASQPYAETAPVGPVTAYGRTKAAGEWAVRAEAPDSLVVRTAWLYGAHGACFPKTIARVVEERGEAAVVDDQVGQPTWTVDVAGIVVRLAEVGAPPGIYHATSSGQTSWFGFAQRVVEAAGHDAGTVLPTTSDSYPRPAKRPAYSVLAHEALTRLGIEPIGSWEQRWKAAAEPVLAGGLAR